MRAEENGDGAGQPNETLSTWCITGSLALLGAIPITADCQKEQRARSRLRRQSVRWRLIFPPKGSFSRILEATYAI
jgi:hypothetical protein